MMASSKRPDAKDPPNQISCLHNAGDTLYIHDFTLALAFNRNKEEVERQRVKFTANLN